MSGKKDRLKIDLSTFVRPKILQKFLPTFPSILSLLKIYRIRKLNSVKSQAKLILKIAKKILFTDKNIKKDDTLKVFNDHKVLSYITI